MTACDCEHGWNTALVNRGEQGCSWERVQCRRCGGTGIVSREQVIREEEGARIRRARLDARKTMAEAAAERRMSVVDYSKLEHGRLLS